MKRFADANHILRCSAKALPIRPFFNKFAYGNQKLACRSHSGVTCHSSAAAKQRFLKPKLNLTRMDVHPTTSGTLFPRNLTIQEPAKLCQQLWIWGQHIVLTAWAHQ